MIPHIRSSALLALALAGSGLNGQTLDRNVQPTPGAPFPLRVPTWTQSVLSNGAKLVVIRKTDLPLVAVSIYFVGGSNNYEPAGKAGVANLAASMLTEGTTTKTGEQISDAEQLLGTSINASISGETGLISFTALNDKLPQVLALLSDELVNSSFPVSGFERNRGRTLVALAQAKDQPNAIAANVFSRVLYGDTHPYGRFTTEESVKTITRDDVIAFFKSYYHPGHAVITVTGDVDPQTVKSEMEKAFASWRPNGGQPSFTYAAAPAPGPTTIYLVNKPKAPQSVFAIGIPGPNRYTEDYYALQVMNNILGGLFQSRINHNIREVRGWSYGVNSRFAYGRGPGPFQAGGGIVAGKTDSALVEFLKELRGAQGSVPFTDEEIEQGKSALVQGLVTRFSSVAGLTSAIGSAYAQDLPESYYRDYAAKINAVTREDLARVAKKYIDMNHLAIVIVGDRESIEPGLRAANVGPLTVLDVEGRPAAP